MMLSLEECRGEKSFTHVAEDGTLTIIAIDRLLASEPWRKCEIVCVPVEAEHAAHVRENGGIEPHRLARITMDDIGRYPITFAHFDTDNSDLLIDGNHRFLCAANHGMPYVFARIVPEGVWRRFEIAKPAEWAALSPDDIREGMKTGFSGIA